MNCSRSHPKTHSWDIRNIIVKWKDTAVSLGFRIAPVSGERKLSYLGLGAGTLETESI